MADAAHALPFALYDAFCDVPFGGSQAAVFGDAGTLDDTLRDQIAKEMGMPASAFVENVAGARVTARFFSTVMELPMCGHGTICLFTRLIETGAIEWDGTEELSGTLALPAGEATVNISRRDDGRPLVMLDIAAPTFRDDQVDRDRLARLLGIDEEQFSRDHAMETAVGDFIHLIVPMANLAAMRALNPDFPGLIELCNDHGIETVAAFSQEVERTGSTLHVRDFCPAVGVWESSSAGTTNGALASYLIRHSIAEPDAHGTVSVTAEQGMEIGRPSTIRSIAHVADGEITRLQVGGVATRIIEGRLDLPPAGGCGG